MDRQGQVGRARLRFLFAAFAFLFATDAAAQTIYVVRHAERQDDSKDTALSDAGRARAEALRRTLADAGVTKVFATTYVRTQQTVQPLAEVLKLKVEALPADDTKGLLAALQKLGARDVAVVVGHSDTVPEVVLHLSGAKVELAHGDYDNLFVLRRDGKKHAMTRLHYGAP